MPRGRWAEGKRKRAKDDGKGNRKNKEKNKSRKMVTPVIKHWI